jgi:beta-glucosidase
MAELDRAVADVLRIKFELGLFENPYKTNEERAQQDILRPEYRTLAKETADKSMVLLKNEGVLPLKQGLKIGVWGELASSRKDMLGAWAIGADGEQCVSLLDALNARSANVVVLEDDLAAAADCDVILAAIGENMELSGEAASRASIELPAGQQEVLEQLVTFGKPVVAVVFSGRPLAMPWVAAHLPAVLMAWHSGVESGNAIADILFGVVNPSGKLTATFPGASGQCPMYYAHINTGRPGGKSKFTSKYLDAPVEPLYPFGYGLSYTTYEYSGLKLEQGEDSLTASVTVKNTGDRAGDEIVQCYFRDLAAQRVRPVKQLVDFAKIHLEAGEEKTVSFTVAYSKLGYYDMTMNYVVEPGEFDLFVGGCSRECLSVRFTL